MTLGRGQRGRTRPLTPRSQAQRPPARESVGGGASSPALPSGESTFQKLSVDRERVGASVNHW